MDPLTYLVEADAICDVGYRVVVPLGKRLLTGTVVQVGADPIPDAKPVYEILDTKPTYSTEMLELTRRISDYYLCSWGEVLAAAIPSGMQPNVAIRVQIVRPLSTNEFEAIRKRAPKRAALLDLLDSTKGEVTVAYLQRKLKADCVSDQLNALLRDGWINITTTELRQSKARQVRCAELRPEIVRDEENFRQTLNVLDKRAPKQSLALAYLYLHRDQSPISINEICRDTGVSASAIETLAEKGYVVVTTKNYNYAAHAGSLAQKDERSFDLTIEQQRAVNDIGDHISSGAFSAHLLQGVTGSGKTIVYQRLIDIALQQGRRALLLVPEISLTPQLGDRFTAIYGDKVAVLHSRLSMGERVQIWSRITQGEIDIVIGARSAVFADVSSLGLIIVDEEHEPSYKQDDPAPRYNGRDVAVMRAHLLSCTIVLGSATPSLESFHHVASGRYRQHTLSQRADNAAFPEVRLVDLRQARKTRQMQGSFALQTLHEIQARIERKEGVLIFLNKRGFASQIQCLDCGDVPCCKHCDVSLTYHKYPNVLRCHYCGYTIPFQMACTTCGSVDMHDVGSGTQRLEEELLEYLQRTSVRSVSIARMDADSTSRKGRHRVILEDFASGLIDVVIGTQMIAKGLDIERCTLVVVANADQSLYHNDFRASERTLQLMLQVSGRAGRSARRPGLVLLQTSSAEHETMQVSMLGEHDRQALHSWYAAEYSTRRDAGYPPFSRFIVIELRSLDDALLQQHADVMHALLPKNEPSLRVYPPQPPSIARIRNHYRRLIVIKNDKSVDPSGQTCRSYLRSALATYQKEYATNTVRIVVDVDARGAW